MFRLQTRLVLNIFNNDNITKLPTVDDILPKQLIKARMDIVK